MATNEHNKWREFLKPLIEAAVAALAVYAAGAQHVSSSAFDSRNTSRAEDALMWPMLVFAVLGVVTQLVHEND